MRRYSILFLERHRTTAKQLLPTLSQRYHLQQCKTRRDAMTCLDKHSYDLVLIDVVSIRFDLARFCGDLRSEFPDILVFLLLEKGMRLDQLPHANGYLRQPYTVRQLQHRLTRILPQSPGEIVEWQGLKLDTDRHFLIWEKNQVPLTPKQTSLALAFLRTPKQLVSRASLMQDVWGTDYLGDTRTLDVHIHWLRKSFTQLRIPFVIETLRGKGYRLVMTTDHKDKEA